MSFFSVKSFCRDFDVTLGLELLENILERVEGEGEDPRFLLVFPLNQNIKLGKIDRGGGQNGFYITEGSNVYMLLSPVKKSQDISPSSKLSTASPSPTPSSVATKTVLTSAAVASASDLSNHNREVKEINNDLDEFDGEEGEEEEEDEEDEDDEDEESGSDSDGDDEEESTRK